jgi:hypothetical protein
VDGKPCLHKDVCAVFISVYDARGNVEAWAFFDADGKPCSDKDGHAKITHFYDATGKIEKTTYYDAQGQEIKE